MQSVCAPCTEKRGRTGSDYGGRMFGRLCAVVRSM